jgi:hypothetical protein
MAATKKLPVILVFGDLAAIGMIVVTIVAWKMGTAAFLGAQGFLMYLFPVVLAIVAVLVEKRRKGGILSFREALRPVFGVMVLAVVLQVLFAWALVHYIDPAFGRALAPLALEKSVAVYRQAGTPEPELQRMIADAKGSDPFSFGAMMIGLARNCIVGFVISAGIAAVVGQRIIKRG